MMARRIVFLVMVCVAFLVSGQSKVSKAVVERQRREAASALKQSSARLESNRKATAQRLSQLASLAAEIEELDREITLTEKEIQKMDTAISCVEDTIVQLDAKVADMSAKYAKALRVTRRSRGGMSELEFIFASEEFGQMWRRYRNMRQFSKWRANRADEIGKAKAVLEQRKSELNRMKTLRVARANALEIDRAKLKEKHRDNDQLLVQLRKEQRQIKSIISEKQREIDNLNRQLEKIIAEELAKAEAEAAKKKNKEKQKSKDTAAEGKEEKDEAVADADNKKTGDERVDVVTVVKSDAKGEATTSRSSAQLSSGFKSSRGKLPWPVDGKRRVVRKFGRHKHPSLPMVVTDNPGIDIGITSGRWVTAVYEGVVSAVFRQPGYNNIVMVRHGDYITVYANLESISVGKGTRVGAGQPIGVVAFDEDNDGMRVLHFEIRREKEKENPEVWLK